MILVVALNPALDVTHHVDGVDWAGVNRPVSVRAIAGGKGLNVAKTLHALRTDVLLLGLAGGPAGLALRAWLDKAGVPAVLTELAAETRRTFAVVDTQRAAVAVFNEPGPAVAADEFAKFTGTYVAALKECSAVVLSGSLPPGLPADSYADLIRMATNAGLPSLLDTSGDALRHGSAAAPAVVKPNLAELAALATAPAVLTSAGEPAAVLTAAREVQACGPAAVVVTLGEAGLLALTSEGVWRAAPVPVAGNPTGAGDAVMAGLARGLALGHSWPQRLREAAALGAATAASPVAGEFSLDDYLRALPSVRIASSEHV